MFDIGFWEITTIAVIALLVIGPDKLPGVARSAGKWVGRARRFVGDVKTDIDRELKQDELRKAIADDVGLDEIKEIMNTDDFKIEDEIINDYQVKAMLNEQKNEIESLVDEESNDSQLSSDDYDAEEDEELKHITDHSDGADYEPENNIANSDEDASKKV